MWTIRRYALRRDFVHKANLRLAAYRRRAEKNEFGDLAHVYRDLAAPGIIFDVGANIGLVTSTMLRLFPRAQVHAFEPTVTMVETLRRRLSHDQRVLINQVAVSDTDGAATFHVDNTTHGGGSNSLFNHSAHFAVRSRVDRYKAVQVQTVTLDQYARSRNIDHIDILKLDIEGAELLALHGAQVLIEKHAVDFIASEIRFIEDYVGQPLFLDLVSYLEPFGYTVFNVYDSADSEIRQALFANAVFVSSAMRRRLQETYGPSRCGWQDSLGPDQ